MKKYLVLLALVTTLPACSSDTKSAPPEPTPPEKCFTLVQAICQKGIQCGTKGTGTQADCEKNSQTSLNCSKATGVGSGYDQCLAAIPATTCSVFNVITPISCLGVIDAPTSSGNAEVGNAGTGNAGSGNVANTGNAGSGNAGSGNAGTGNTATAPGLCRTYVEAHCTRLFTCTNQVTSQNVPPAYTQCLVSMSTDLGCETAKGVSSTYDTCLSETSTMVCVTWGTGGVITPNSCSNVITQ